MERKFNKDNFDDDSYSEKKPRERRPSRRDDDNRNFSKSKRSFDKSSRPKRRFDDDDDEGFRPKRSFKGGRKEGYSSDNKRKKDFKGGAKRRFEDDKKPRRRDVTAESEILTEIVNRRRMEGRKSPQKQRILSLEVEEQHGPIRLNKYIANAGICSRRDADVLIASGAITVNGEVVTEMGHKVMPTDEVRYGDKVLQREKPVYVLLNKPKDYITTTDDERDRANVMQLVRDATATPPACCSSPTMVT